MFILMIFSNNHCKVTGNIVLPHKIKVVFVELFRVIYTYYDSGRYCKIQTALENVTNTSSERIQRKVIVNLSNHSKVTGNIVLPHKIK